jgi:hypothetical protein
MSAWVKKNEGGSIRQPDMTLRAVAAARQAKQDAWDNFWSGPVEMVSGAGECMPRYVWVNEFILELNTRIVRKGYSFAFSQKKMCSKLMHWLYELETAATERRQPGIPRPHTKHRNKFEDFTEFDYRMGFSAGWIHLIDYWKTTDMEERYEDTLKAFVCDFVYCNIDTDNSPAIVEADRKEAEYLRDLEEYEEEHGIRRFDDRRRTDPYYQDAGYFKGNRDYS